MISKNEPLVPIGIDIERLVHSREVGCLAVQLGREMFDWDEQHCQQMFLLGLVHDCGYEFVDDLLDHPIVGSNLLKESGYFYWREVRWHGIPHAPYYSNELLVLNIADLLVGRDGRRVTLIQRLNDIARRYGTESEQFIRAKQLVCEIDASLEKIGSNLRVLRELWNPENAEKECGDLL